MASCFEIRVLSNLGTGSCPGKCELVAGPPKPVQCPHLFTHGRPERLDSFVTLKRGLGRALHAPERPSADDHAANQEVTSRPAPDDILRDV